MKGKKLIIGCVWALAVALWIGIGVFYVSMKPDLRHWTIAVSAGALAIELAFWTTAALLGLSMWQSRRAVLRFLASPFRRGA